MTVGTNALLERRGTRTALVTTEGFRDVLEIARQNRPFLYDLAQNRPPPLIPCELRFTVKERMGPAGEVEALDEASIKETVSAIKESKVEAVAVCLIGGGAGALISIYLVGATGGSYWPVVAWMVLLCIITFVSVLVAAQTYQGGEYATEQSGAASDRRRARLGG